MFGHARNAISAYQKAGVEAAVEVADPHRLILLLFEGAQAGVGAARAASTQKQVAAKGESDSQAIDIISDDLGGAGGDDGHHLDMGIAHQKDIHRSFHPIQGAEHGPDLMHRGGGDLEALLEMLGDEQAYKHDTPLTTVDYADAILDADAGVLGTRRLAGEDRVDNPGASLIFEFTSHLVIPS